MYSVPSGGALLLFWYPLALFLPDTSEAGRFQKEVEDLPLDLRQFIQEDNWRLEQEAEEWEEEQSCKIPQREPSPASDSQDLSSESGPGNTTSVFCSFNGHGLLSVHCQTGLLLLIPSGNASSAALWRGRALLGHPWWHVPDPQERGTSGVNAAATPCCAEKL